MDDILKFYRDYFNLDEVPFIRIDHQEAMIAEVYKVELPSPLILKICTREKDFHRELYFLNFLAGFLPVPKIHQVADPSDGRPGAILMEYLEGTLIREEDWTHALAYEVGEALATLHSQRNDVYGDVTQTKIHTKSVRQYFEEKFFEELEECVNHLPKKLIVQCRDFYQSHQQLLDDVDGPCLVHRDFRPGNMIVQNGCLKGIIDWASGRFGFAEQDFCSMEHRNWPHNPEYKESLLAGYNNIRKVPDYQAIMPLLRLGRALAVVGYTVQSGTWNGKDKAIYQYNREFLELFLGFH